MKFVNHNSADLYSFDPVSGKARYEKHLFSQDAGEPVSSHGLLYWPFEDSRFSPGHGEFMVTNGRDWGWRVIPKGRAIPYPCDDCDRGHDRRGRFLPGRRSWGFPMTGGRAGPWPMSTRRRDRRVSRITALANLDGRIFAGVTTWYDDHGPKLLRMGINGVTPVPGWPGGSEVAALASYKGWVYGVNTTADGAALLRTDGTIVEPLTGPKGVHR